MTIFKRKRNPGFEAYKCSTLPDEQDTRDYVLVPESVKAETLPQAVDLSKYLPEVKSQGSLGSCFPGKTKVLMEDYSFKPIKEILIGERVFTHTGLLKKVTKLFKRKWQGRTYKIYPLGNFQEIECTPEHPILTQRGWIKSEELTKQDYIFIPFKNTWKDASVYELEQDPDFLWVLGIYLAEGSLDYLRVNFSIDAKRQDIVDKIVRTMSKYGANVKIYPKPKNHVITVRLQGKKWYDLFLELGNKICDKKRINKRLMLIDPELQWHIFKGWEDGDGLDNPIKNRQSIKTTSLELAEQMLNIAINNKIFATLTTNQQKNRRRAYAISYVHKSKDSYRRFATKDGIFVKIQKIQKIKQYMGEHVYNIEVEDDNSYLVNGYAVHNCGSHALVSAVELLLKKNKERWYIELSELYHYYKVRVLNQTFPEDRGQTVRDGCKVLHKNGVCPELLCPYNVNKANSEPSLVAEALSRFWKINSYLRVLGKDSVKQCLHEGFPVVIGAKVYDSFILNRTGEITLPDIKNGENYRGGHAVLICGYDDQKQAFRIFNSWGNWGRKGLAWMPYEYYDKYVFDAWKVSM